MADWTSIISFVAAAAGVATGLGQVLTTTRTTRRQAQDLERLKDERQNKAIASSDIEVIGRYLYEQIGAVRISDVVSDGRVRHRTLLALSRLTQFIGEDPPSDPGEPATTSVEGRGPVSDELARSWEQILSGEVWNGLALMRRHIELILRASDPELQAARMGAGQLITAAERSGSLSGEVVPQLRYAVNVANKAIHGEPVGVDVALEAVQSADDALRRMRASGDFRTR